MDVVRLSELFRVEGSNLVRNRNQGKAKAGAIAGGLDGKGYLRVRVDGSYVFVHHVVWALTHGVWPDHSVDHRDGVRTNNAPSNLRACTQQENLWNSDKRSDNTSGVKGVTCVKSRRVWRARVEHNGMAYSKFHADQSLVIDRLNRTRATMHGEFACQGR